MHPQRSTCWAPSPAAWTQGAEGQAFGVFALLYGVRLISQESSYFPACAPLAPGRTLPASWCPPGAWSRRTGVSSRVPLSLGRLVASACLSVVTPIPHRQNRTTLTETWFKFPGERDRNAKAHHLHFLKSVLFWKNLQLAFQCLLKRSLCPQSAVALALKNGRFSTGVLRGECTGFGVGTPKFFRYPRGPCLDLTSHTLRLCAQDDWQTTHPTYPPSP